MSNQIFKKDQPISKTDPVYHKIPYDAQNNGFNHIQYVGNQEEEDDEELVIGEPIGN